MIYIDKRMVRPESLTQKQCRGPQTTVEHFLDPLPHSQRYLESCFVSPVVEDRAADKIGKVMLPQWFLAADISVLWCGTSRTADHCRTFVIISAEYRQVVVSRGWSSLVVTGLSWLVVAGRGWSWLVVWSLVVAWSVVSHVALDRAASSER